MTRRQFSISSLMVIVLLSALAFAAVKAFGSAGLGLILAGSLFLVYLAGICASTSRAIYQRGDRKKLWTWVALLGWLHLVLGLILPDLGIVSWILASGVFVYIGVGVSAIRAISVRGFHHGAHGVLK